MKLLLITDGTIPSALEKINGGYSYGNIQIQHLFYQSENDLKAIRSKIQSERFHLVLGLTHGVFMGNFIQEEVIVNAVNNYLSVPLRSAKEIFEKSDIEHPPISIVNRTTSYFNVFLDIPKAVSLTTSKQVIDLELSRLDILSEKNYYLAYYLYKSKCNYYLLNYASEMPAPRLLEILQKIE